MQERNEQGKLIIISECLKLYTGNYASCEGDPVCVYTVYTHIIMRTCGEFQVADESFFIIYLYIFKDVSLVSFFFFLEWNLNFYVSLPIFLFFFFFSFWLLLLVSPPGEGIKNRGRRASVA